ncbi:hypothetical protein KY359_05020 [Candidatus Woesearchaeota archaeon]|nr:hypothetical protein [Candidatus Woesearchaeota archaeon]
MTEGIDLTAHSPVSVSYTLEERTAISGALTRIAGKIGDYSPTLTAEEQDRMNLEECRAFAQYCIDERLAGRDPYRTELELFEKLKEDMRTAPARELRSELTVHALQVAVTVEAVTVGLISLFRGDYGGVGVATLVAVYSAKEMLSHRKRLSDRYAPEPKDSLSDRCRDSEDCDC